MIIHCTKKLAAKLPAVSTEALEEDSPLGGWHANLYTIDRRNCLLFCHNETRYTLFLPGLRKPQFAELGRWFRELFTASLACMGMTDQQVRRAELALGPVRFDDCTDRSVQGSLRIAKQDLEAWICQLSNVMDADPLAASARLNERPATIYGKWIRPGQAMCERVQAL